MGYEPGRKTSDISSCCHDLLGSWAIVGAVRLVGETLMAKSLLALIYGCRALLASRVLVP
jgi:hypothetical protein